MPEAPYLDGRTGGGSYVQDPVTGALTKVSEQPSPDQAQPVPPSDMSNGSDAGSDASDKKGK